MKAYYPICHGYAELKTNDLTALFKLQRTKGVFCSQLFDDNPHKNVLMK